MNRRSIVIAALLMFVSSISCDNRAPQDVPSPPPMQAAPKPPPPQPAPPSPTPAAVAWVDGEPISAEELDALLVPPEKAVGAEEHFRQLRRRTLDALIDRRLLDRHLRDALPDDNVVDREVERRVDETWGTEEVLHQYLAARRKTPIDFWNDSRRDLALSGILPPVEPPTEHEIRALYAKTAQSPAVRLRYRLEVISVRNTPQLATLRERIERVRDPETFSRLGVELERTHGKTVAEVAEPQWVDAKSVAPALLAELDAAPASTPVLSGRDHAFRAYWIHERSEEPTPEYTAMRPVLEREVRRRHMAQRKQALIAELRERAEIRYAEPAPPLGDAKGHRAIGP